MDCNKIISSYIIFQASEIFPVRGPTKLFQICMISGFCHSVNETLALLGLYTAQIGSLLPTFWDSISSIFKSQRVREDLVCWTLEAGTKRSSQNITDKRPPTHTISHCHVNVIHMRIIAFCINFFIIACCPYPTCSSVCNYILRFLVTQ